MVFSTYIRYVDEDVDADSGDIQRSEGGLYQALVREILGFRWKFCGKYFYELNFSGCRRKSVTWEDLTSRSRTSEFIDRPEKGMRDCPFLFG